MCSLAPPNSRIHPRKKLGARGLPVPRIDSMDTSWGRSRQEVGDCNSFTGNSPSVYSSAEVAGTRFARDEMTEAGISKHESGLVLLLDFGGFAELDADAVALVVGVPDGHADVHGA